MKNIFGAAFKKISLSVRRDFWRKLIALFFAVLVYYSVEVQIAGERKIPGVRVEMELPPELINVGQQELFVTVTARGPNKVLDEIEGKDLKAIVPVAYEDFIPGRPFRFHLRPAYFKGYRGVKVIDVDAPFSEITLNLQRRISRDVPVTPKFHGELAQDYRRVETRCIPTVVQVTGPENLVSELKEISTKPIPLDKSVVESFEYGAQLEYPGQVRLAPNQVTVQIDIARNYERRVFKAVPVSLLSEPGSNRRVNVELVGSPRVDVTVSGLGGPVSELRFEEIKPYLDVSKLADPGIYTVPVGCYVKGDSLDVKEIYPEQIQVKITR